MEITAVSETDLGGERARPAHQPWPPRDAEGKALVTACLAGDTAARARFQERFASLVYRFAHVAGGEDIEPGEFYLHMLEDDRLYKRLRSYEGRASLGPYLRGYVLPDLLRQFRNMKKKTAIDCVSLDSDPRLEPSVENAAGSAEAPAAFSSASRCECPDFLSLLDADKRLLVKLLYIEDFSLAPEELQLLSRRSSRPMREVAEEIEKARESVRQRLAAQRQKLDQAETATQWILRYDRQLARVRRELANAVPGSQTRGLQQQESEIERKRARRQEQRDRVIEESRRAQVTLRYREIALILGVPVGTVGAQVTRLRQQVLKLVADGTIRREREM